MLSFAAFINSPEARSLLASSTAYGDLTIKANQDDYLNSLYNVVDASRTPGGSIEQAAFDMVRRGFSGLPSPLLAVLAAFAHYANATTTNAAAVPGDSIIAIAGEDNQSIDEQYPMIGPGGAQQTATAQAAPSKWLWIVLAAIGAMIA